MTFFILTDIVSGQIAHMFLPLPGPNGTPCLLASGVLSSGLPLFSSERPVRPVLCPSPPSFSSAVYRSRPRWEKLWWCPHRWYHHDSGLGKDDRQLLLHAAFRFIRVKDIFVLNILYIVTRDAPKPIADYSEWYLLRTIFWPIHWCISNSNAKSNLFILFLIE